MKKNKKFIFLIAMAIMLILAIVMATSKDTSSSETTVETMSNGIDDEKVITEDPETDYAPEQTFASKMIDEVIAIENTEGTKNTSSSEQETFAQNDSTDIVTEIEEYGSGSAGFFSGTEDNGNFVTGENILEYEDELF